MSFASTRWRSGEGALSFGMLSILNLVCNCYEAMNNEYPASLRPQDDCLNENTKEFRQTGINEFSSKAAVEHKNLNNMA